MNDYAVDKKCVDGLAMDKPWPLDDTALDKDQGQGPGKVELGVPSDEELITA